MNQLLKMKLVTNMYECKIKLQLNILQRVKA